MSANLPTAPRRSWRSFRLRTILFFITVLGIALGVQVNSAKKQQRAVRAIRQYGGSVAYGYQFNENGDFDPKIQPPVAARLLDWLGDDFFFRAVEVDLTRRAYYDRVGTAPGDRFTHDGAMPHVGQLPHVRELVLKDKQVTDESMVYLKRLTKLETLAMWSAPEVSDNGMRQLENLKHLQLVDISDSQMTDESLRMFGKMPSLKVLRLEGHRFTDQGLAHLKNLPKLNTLWINSQQSQITDEGLPCLHEMKSLESIGLQHLPVTEEGIAKLQATLPDAHILHSLPKQRKRPPEPAVPDPQ